MKLKLWRLLTILLVALCLGMAECHLLEMPVRLKYAPALWSQVTNIEGTYRYFAWVGAFIELGAVLTSTVLAVFMRRRSGFGFTFTGAVSTWLGQAIWWGFVKPVNDLMVHWTPTNLPNNFAALRQRWEYAHGTRAVVLFIGLAALLWSVLRETPTVSETRHEEITPEGNLHGRA